MDDKFAVGMKIRRSVLGNTHVDSAEAAKSDLDQPFQTLIVEGAWGTENEGVPAGGLFVG